MFAPEVIQPIFDLANPDHPMHQLNMQNNQAEMSGNGMNLANDSPALQDDSSDMLNVNTSKLDSITIQKLQQFQQILIRQTSGEANNSSDKVKFNKKLLDFEYESDDEVDKSADTHMNPMQNMLPSVSSLALKLAP